MKDHKVLEFIQKKLHIDIRYILKNGGIISLSHGFGTLCGFSVTLLLGNFIDSTTYGQYKYIAAIAGILSAFSLTGAASVVLQSVSKGFDGSLFYEKKLSALWGTPAVTLSILFGGYYILQEDYSLGFGVILMSILIYIQSIFILHTSFLNGKKDFRVLAINQAVGALITVLAITCIILLNVTTVLWIALAYQGSQTIFQYITYNRTLKRYSPDPTLLDASERTLSRHLSIGNVIGIISEYIDKILIFQLIGPYQLALYAFSVGIPDQVRSINKLINTLVLPRLSVKNDAELKNSIQTHTKTYVIGSLLIAGIFWFISRPLYEFLFPQYIEAARYASIYMLILPIIAFGALHGHALQVKNQVRSLYVIRIFDPILKIILFILLIPHLGILGAILSILISKLIAVSLQIILYFHNAKMNFNGQ